MLGLCKMRDYLFFQHEEQNHWTTKLERIVNTVYFARLCNKRGMLQADYDEVSLEIMSTKKLTPGTSSHEPALMDGWTHAAN